MATYPVRGQQTPDYWDDDLQAYILAAVGVEVVHHGTDPDVTRPDRNLVYWVGTATPGNAETWDFWLAENV